MSVTLNNMCFGPVTVYFGADDIGATEEGAVITRTPEHLLVQPEQLTGAAISYLVSEGYSIAFTLIEPTIKNLDLFVFGHAEQILVCARFDNLGKGASGAAVQNLNLMLGVEETAGLT